MELRLPLALLALAGSAPIMAAKPQSATPLANPAEWVTSSDYPTGALRRENEGTTGFRLTVGPDGRVSACLVTVSSGWSALDEATCRLISERARFSPATDRRGRAVQDTYSNRVRWVIPTDKRNPRDSQLIYSALIAPDGKISDCRIEHLEGYAAKHMHVGPMEPCGFSQVAHGYVDTSGAQVAKRVRRTMRTEVLDASVEPSVDAINPGTSEPASKN